MSEKLPLLEKREALPSAEVKTEHLEARSRPEKAKAEKDPAQAASEARQAIAETTRIDTRPNPLEKLKQDEKAPQAPTSTYVNRELKQITLQRELLHIRRQLPKPQRVLSRVVHQPVVRAVSETAGKTISRPSGLLGGGLVALLGTTGYLYLASSRGFRYNYIVFLILFVAGFIVGLALELLVHLATRRNLEE